MAAIKHRPRILYDCKILRAENIEDMIDLGRRFDGQFPGSSCNHWDPFDRLYRKKIKTGRKNFVIMLSDDIFEMERELHKHFKGGRNCVRAVVKCPGIVYMTLNDEATREEPDKSKNKNTVKDIEQYIFSKINNK